VCGAEKCARKSRNKICRCRNRAYRKMPQCVAAKHRRHRSPRRPYTFHAHRGASPVRCLQYRAFLCVRAWRHASYDVAACHAHACSATSASRVLQAISRASHLTLICRAGTVATLHVSHGKGKIHAKERRAAAARQSIIYAMQRRKRLPLRRSILCIFRRDAPSPRSRYADIDGRREFRHAARDALTPRSRMFQPHDMPRRADV